MQSSAVTIVGMVMGTLLILTAIAVFWSKKAFPAGGIGVTLVGLVLIGMSQWSTIKLKAGGVDVEVELKALKKQVQETAAATADVATETRNAAAGADVTRRQVAILTSQLAERALVAPQASIDIQSALRSAPQFDEKRLVRANERLERIGTPGNHPPVP